jgi:predicted acetyltransferase
MDYRALRPDEIATYRAHEEYAFGVAPADSDAFMENAFAIEHTRVLAKAQGDIKAVLSNLPFTLYMEGKQLPVAGIASVASLPENRRGGYVGELLLRCIAETREQGRPLSFLYPFKQSFYRRYGWEVASSWVESDIPIAQFAAYRKSAGVIRRYLPGEVDWQVLASLYAPWAAQHWGHMVRETEQHWNRMVLTPWSQRKWHVALWSPGPGAAPEGYLIYRLDQHKEKQTLIIRQLLAQTRAAEQGLCGFVANHDSQVEQVHMRTLLQTPLTHLIGDTYEMKSTLKHGWMLRLVDFKEALEARPWLSGVGGSVCVEVSDEYAPWNTGTWRIALEGGRAVVTAAPAEAPALSADVQTWAQLYAGFVRPQAAVETGRLQISDRAGLCLLNMATTGEPLFFPEFF